MINYQFLLIPDFGNLTHYGNGMLQYVKNENREIQSVQISLQQDVSDVFSLNSWSNLTPNDSFEICFSSGFQNT